MIQTKTNDRPKVLIFKSNLLPISETFIREQAIHLKNWKPILVGYNRVVNGLDLDGLDIILLKSANSFFDKMIRRFHLMMGFPLKREVSRLKKENAQLIHVHFGNEAIDVWPVAKTLEQPLIVTLHGSDINIYREWWESGNGSYFMRSYPKKLLKLAAEKNVTFIAVSNAIKKRAIEYGIPPEKIHINYIGVDTQKFIPGPIPLSKRREILFVGRLVKKKGCKYLLEAFSKIQKKFPRYQLVIIGDGPLKKELRQYSQNNGIRAIFFGAQSSEQVRKKLGDARILCLPSITIESGDAEGLGMVIIEAQSSGVPVITSALGGATEGIIHGVTGFRHEEKDVFGMTTSLEKLLSDDVFAERAGVAARQNVLDKMDICGCTSKLESIYSSVFEAFKNSNC
ncbi:MAG: glycosyltransferase [Proteobacteria bacterium]|nr:glycosyltransferase [Pseudomonadota bacterium]MBU1388824.1 glycosyltransferase [Pseudomonadota bacterium]MBU1543165.1 glycosyltransferase [Pseudomonadota bacterium]